MLVRPRGAPVDVPLCMSEFGRLSTLDIGHILVVYAESSC
jgi:hypothetical protein